MLPTNYALENFDLRHLCQAQQHSNFIFSSTYTVGHITREFSVVIAPLLDQFESVNSVAFKLLLSYSDINHSRIVYDIDLDVCNSEMYVIELMYSFVLLRRNS